MPNSKLKILLVEDNPDDVRLTEYALKKGNLSNELYHAEDGEQAEHFLNQAGTDKETPLPDLIMLDLNLPKKDGFSVLATIKGNPKLMMIPVIILSTSSNYKDILNSYKGHANCYIQKSSDLSKFLEVMQNIKKFWVNTAVLPTSLAS